MIRETSLAAYDSVRDIESWTTRVRDYIKKAGGATADEVAAHFNVGHNTTSPRITLLIKRGLVRDSGTRRLTRASREAVVWELV
jgi:hypothetical protein